MQRKQVTGNFMAATGEYTSCTSHNTEPFNLQVANRTAPPKLDRTTQKPEKGHEDKEQQLGPVQPPVAPTINTIAK